MLFIYGLCAVGIVLALAMVITVAVAWVRGDIP